MPHTLATCETCHVTLDQYDGPTIVMCRECGEETCEPCTSWWDSDVDGIKTRCTECTTPNP